MATCPKCNSRDTASELPMDGDTTCNTCGFKDKTAKFKWESTVVDLSGGFKHSFKSYADMPTPTAEFTYPVTPREFAEMKQVFNIDKIQASLAAAIYTKYRKHMRKFKALGKSKRK